MRPEELEIMDRVLEIILGYAADYPPPENDEQLEKNLEEIYRRVVTQGSANRVKGRSVTVTPPDLYNRLLYNLKRDIIGLGP